MLKNPLLLRTSNRPTYKVRGTVRFKLDAWAQFLLSSTACSVFFSSRSLLFAAVAWRRGLLCSCSLPRLYVSVTKVCFSGFCAREFVKLLLARRLAALQRTWRKQPRICRRVGSCITLAMSQMAARSMHLRQFPLNGKIATSCRLARISPAQSQA